MALPHSRRITLDTEQILLLAFLQGLTEFLPISSSAHLILAPLLFGYELQGLAFDVAVHVGTLAAVVLYFRREIAAMAAALAGSLKAGQIVSAEARLAWMIVLATLPVLLLGLPLKALLEILRQDDRLIALVIAGTTIGFGLLLWLVDARGRRVRGEYDIGWTDALGVGLMQAISIVPGTSRSGITITAGLMLGLTREAASRFSFLLAIPTILMAGALELLELVESTEPVDYGSLGLGVVLSFTVAYLTIGLFLRLVERIGMVPFVLYRLFLGVVILVLVF